MRDFDRRGMLPFVRAQVRAGMLPADAARDAWNTWGMHGGDRQAWVDEIEALYAPPSDRANEESTMAAAGASWKGAVPTAAEGA